MGKRSSPSAVCSRCANRTRQNMAQGWPRNDEGLELVIICPHCIAISGASCCVCHGARRLPVTLLEAMDLMRNLWARPGCSCGACLSIGKSPSGQQDVTQAPTRKLKIA